MVVIAIHNEVIQSDKPIGISFRRLNQLSGDMILSVFEKVTSQSLDSTPSTSCCDAFG